MSKSIFPKITVCPPKGTSTSLNYDLVKAENQTLKKTSRNQMTELAKTLFQDGLFLELVANESSFKEDEKYRNWYEGKSLVSLSYDGVLTDFDYDVDEYIYKYIHYYDMHTYAISGKVSTPWFGDKYDGEKFVLHLSYWYYIHLPTLSHNMTLVVVMKVDSMETSLGNENVNLFPPGFKQRTDINQKFGPSYNKTFRFNVTEQFREHNSTLRINFYRYISQYNLQEWENRRMTGMSVEWYIEDNNGDTEEVEEKNSYAHDNEMFIKTVNMLYYSEKIIKVSEEEIWRNIKIVRVELVNSFYSHDWM